MMTDTEKGLSVPRARDGRSPLDVPDARVLPAAGFARDGAGLFDDPAPLRFARVRG